MSERDELTLILADNLPVLMKRRGMTAAEVNRKAKMSGTGVGDIMSGRSRSVTLKTVCKLAKALRVQPLSLLEKPSSDQMRDDVVEVFRELPEIEKERLLLTARAWAGSRSKPEDTGS